MPRIEEARVDMIVIEAGRVRRGNCALPVRQGVVGAAGRELPCRTGDPDLWFAESSDDLERAKGLCGGCAIRSRCLADALDRAEPWGVWGGEIFRAGVVVAHKRSRGRPRKNPAIGCNGTGIPAATGHPSSQSARIARNDYDLR